ncbi:MAG: RNA polymerase sigma factor [Terriglobia bacterium]
MAQGHGEAGELDSLLARARTGDGGAFAELYGLFARRVLGLCRHMLGSEEAAEDARSEIFLRAQKAMRTYDASLPFQSWLLSIASHYCVDQLRRRKVERRLFEAAPPEYYEPAATNLSPLAELLVSEERARVQAALARLPERYRLPLVLRYSSELSYDQIASALGLSRNHVATLLFRGKQELRKVLGGSRKERVQ